MYEVKIAGEVDDRQQLGPEDRMLVARLAAREREVRAREMQRRTDAGLLAMGIDYIYERGPDGKLRAQGGRIRIVVPPAACQNLPVKVRFPAANPPAAQKKILPIETLQQISRDRVKQLGDMPGVCAWTSFGGLNRTA